MSYELVKFAPKRTFGVELEFTDGKTREFLRDCIMGVGEKAQVSGYQHDTGKEKWTCKTDSSCGYEIASRVLGSTRSVLQTLTDLNILEKVATELERKKAPVSTRCGFHVHVWVGDLEEEHLHRLLSYWVRLEKTVMDMMPERRRNNSYCPCHSTFFAPNQKVALRDMINRGFKQRGSLNWAWYGQRKTVEFRVAEGTTDPDTIKNWVRFLLHFCEMVRYMEDRPNLNWLTFEESLSILGLYNSPGEKKVFRILSPALVELRQWMLQRTKEYAAYRDASEIKSLTKKMLKDLYS